MNGDDTLSLWRLGKGAWEGWARSVREKKDALKASRMWSVDWYGEGQNDVTKAWLEEATADFTGAAFDAGAGFAGFPFPGPAIFERARFSAPANFSGATFMDNACFDKAQFAASGFSNAKFSGFASFTGAQFGAGAQFENAEFLKACDLAPSACFRGAQFSGAVGFEGAQFAGSAEFLKTAFAAASFERCEFRGDTRFGSARFGETASFAKTRFSGARVDFDHCVFDGKSNFSEAHFGGSWAGLVTSGACCVSFENARFEKDATFRKTWFVGGSQFTGTQFNALAAFDESLFVMPANFAPGVFSAGASFTNARFEHEANFAETQFLGACEFTAARFAAEARFPNTRFAAPARFAGVEFLGAADFRGAAADATLAFDGAKCVTAPDLAEGKFAQAVSLDALIIIKQKRGPLRWLQKLRQEEKRLMAPETLMAFASRQSKAAPDGGPGASERPPSPPAGPQETAQLEKERETPEKIPAASPAAALPAPAIATRPASSLHPRPLFRPLLVWICMILAFTPFYLSQSPTGPAASGARPQNEGASVYTRVLAAVAALSQTTLETASKRSCVHGDSHAAAEALFLSARNSLAFVRAENDHVMRRVYGCLYGVKDAAPVVPVAVSLGSLLQTALSLILLAPVVLALFERWKRR